MEISRTIWQKVNLPTIALGLLWIVHSLATTAYVPWQNTRQRAVLDRDLATINGVLRLQERLSQLRNATHERPVDPLPPAELFSDIQRSLAALQTEIHDAESSVLLADLQRRMEFIRPRLASDRRTDPPSTDPEIAHALEDAIALCHRLVKWREQMLLNAVDERSQTDAAVMIVRAVLLVMGLIVGIGLAWWTATGINRTLSQIVVTLKGIEGDLPFEVGRIDLPPSASDHDLLSLKTHVQSVVVAIRHVAEELRQARQEIVRAERLAAVGQLAAGVAHEIRNPLTSVRLIVQRAAERHPVHALNDEQMSVLLEEVSRMETTIQGLLDFARPSKPQRVRIDMREIIQRTVNLLAARGRQSRVRIVTAFDDRPDQSEVYADPALIQQVLVNLSINALDSMPSGGELQIRLSGTSEEVIVQVQDSGTGISREVLDHLFEPFVTTKATGSGLGLAISQQIVKEHQGSLVASNVPGGGALFTLRIPCRVPSISDAIPEGFVNPAKPLLGQPVEQPR